MSDEVNNLYKGTSIGRSFIQTVRAMVVEGKLTPLEEQRLWNHFDKAFSERMAEFQNSAEKTALKMEVSSPRQIEPPCPVLDVCYDLISPAAPRPSTHRATLSPTASATISGRSTSRT